MLYADLVFFQIYALSLSAAYYPDKQQIMSIAVIYVLVASYVL